MTQMPSLELIQAEESYLRSMARELVHGEAEARRLVRDALRLAERARARFDQRTSIRGWATTILIRCYLASINDSRSRARRHTPRIGRDAGRHAGRLLQFGTAPQATADVEEASLVLSGAQDAD